MKKGYITLQKMAAQENKFTAQGITNNCAGKYKWLRRKSKTAAQEKIFVAQENLNGCAENFELLRREL